LLIPVNQQLKQFMRKFKHEKSIQLLNFFAIKEGGVINRMKALKLIFLSDRLHLRKYGRPILNDSYYAMKFGPVASKTCNLADNLNLSPEEEQYRLEYIKTESDYTYSSIKPVNNKVFSQTDRNSIESIYSTFGHLGEYQLSDETHEYPEWKQFKGKLESGEIRRVKMKYEDFFLNGGSEGNPIFTEKEEILMLAKDIYIENTNLQSLL
jgi:uncharacterized phage-associated protein